MPEPRHSLEDNIKIDVREVGWEGVDWTCLARHMDNWRAVMNRILNHQVS
jgi:hypothetical protein